MSFRHFAGAKEFQLLISSLSRPKFVRYMAIAGQDCWIYVVHLSVLKRMEIYELGRELQDHFTIMKVTMGSLTCFKDDSLSSIVIFGDTNTSGKKVASKCLQNASKMPYMSQFLQ